VLKRNKTLKVLNLSDNKIDAAGLQVLAQALVSILL
jgi:Ran GTPase-activating protein (RanGAP) involved in mRNA processing and transport